MSHDQLSDPSVLPEPPSKPMHGSLHELNAKMRFELADRRMLDGFSAYAEQQGLALGTLETGHLPAFAHTINGFGSMVVNKRFDVLERLPLARVIESPTVIDINRSQAAVRLRDKRHGVGRSVKLDNGTMQSSFPAVQIDRFIDEFYKRFGRERYAHDPIIRAKFEEGLQYGQVIIFPYGQLAAPSEQLYKSQPLALTPLATKYPQITMYARLRNMFRSLDLQLEADAADVVLAACGQRLLGLRKGVGTLATYDRYSALVQQIGQEELPEDELPDKIVRRRKKIIDAED